MTIVFYSNKIKYIYERPISWLGEQWENPKMVKWENHCLKWTTDDPDMYMYMYVCICIDVNDKLLIRKIINTVFVHDIYSSTYHPSICLTIRHDRVWSLIVEKY